MVVVHFAEEQKVPSSNPPTGGAFFISFLSSFSLLGCVVCALLAQVCSACGSRKSMKWFNVLRGLFGLNRGISREIP